MKILTLTVILFLSAGILAACAAPASPTPPQNQPISTDTPTPAPYPAVSPTSPLPVEPTLAAYPPGQPTPGALPLAVQRALDFFAKKNNTSVDQLTLVAFVRMDFPDACLGAPLRGESCAQLITPGYTVSITYQNKPYALHTNLYGTSTRILP